MRQGHQLDRYGGGGIPHLKLLRDLVFRLRKLLLPLLPNFGLLDKENFALLTSNKVSARLFREVEEFADEEGETASEREEGINILSQTHNIGMLPPT